MGGENFLRELREQLLLKDSAKRSELIVEQLEVLGRISYLN